MARFQMIRYEMAMTMRDRLISVGVLYMVLALAGASVAFAPGSIAMRAGSLLIYAALLALYAIGTAPGRRTGFRVYFIAGAIYPVVMLVLAFVPLGDNPPEWVIGALPWIFAAADLGFTPSGGDTPPPVLLLPWLFNVLMPIVAVIGIREFSGVRQEARDLVRQGDQ